MYCVLRRIRRQITCRLLMDKVYGGYRLFGLSGKLACEVSAPIASCVRRHSSLVSSMQRIMDPVPDIGCICTITGGATFTVPLRAARPRPTLGLPASGILECGPCQVYGVGTAPGTETSSVSGTDNGAHGMVVKAFACHNTGANGRFRFVVPNNQPKSAADIAALPQEYWDVPTGDNADGAVPNVLEVGPFTISPAVVALKQDAVSDLVVRYRAREVGSESATVCVVDDSCRCTTLTLTGRGERPRFTVVSNSSSAKILPHTSLADTSTELLFDPTYLEQVAEHRVTIANNSALDLPYEWVLDAYEASQGVVSEVDVFGIYPSRGVFGMNGTETFVVRYCASAPQRCAVRARMVLVDTGGGVTGTSAGDGTVDGTVDGSHTATIPTTDTGTGDGTIYGPVSGAVVTVALFAECKDFAVSIVPPIIDFNAAALAPDQSHRHAFMVENSSAVAVSVNWISALVRGGTKCLGTLYIIPGALLSFYHVTRGELRVSIYI